MSMDWRGVRRNTAQQISARSEVIHLVEVRIHRGPGGVIRVKGEAVGFGYDHTSDTLALLGSPEGGRFPTLRLRGSQFDYVVVHASAKQWTLPGDERVD